MVKTMNNKTIEKNANNLMWVEYWIRNAHPSFKDYEIYAEKYDLDRWICEIELPLIETKVKSICYTESSAVLNATRRAALLINQYLKDHPELNIKNEFKGKQYAMEIDKDGRIISCGFSDAQRRQAYKREEKRVQDILNAANKLVEFVEKNSGSTENMFISITNHTLYDDELTIDEILDQVESEIMAKYPHSNHRICYDKDNGNVVVIGKVVNVPLKPSELN